MIPELIPQAPPPPAPTLRPQKYDRLHDWNLEAPPEKSSNWLMYLFALTMLGGLAGFGYLNLKSRRQAPRIVRPVEAVKTVETIPSPLVVDEPSPVVQVPEPVVSLVTPAPDPVISEEAATPTPEKQSKRGAAKAKLQARVEAPLELTAPENNQQFFEGDDSAGVTFSWSGRAADKAKGQSYRLEISTEPTFGTIVGTFDVNGTSLSNARTKLDAGKYYWRVSLIDRAGTRIEQTKEFAFTFRPRPRLMPPKSKMKIKSN